LAQQTGDPLAAQKLAMEGRRLDIQERGVAMEGRRADLEERRLQGGVTEADEPTAEWQDKGVKVKGTLSQWEARQKEANEASRRGEIAALQTERQQMQDEIAAGDDRYGFANAWSRRSRLPAIDRRLAELGAGTGPAPAGAKGGGKSLDKATAAAILQEAGGDKQKARQLARERGYSF
jgi:hypothetical protein